MRLWMKPHRFAAQTSGVVGKSVSEVVEEDLVVAVEEERPGKKECHPNLETMDEAMWAELKKRAALETSVRKTTYGRLRWYEEAGAAATGVALGGASYALDPSGVLTVKKMAKHVFWLAVGWLGGRETRREMARRPELVPAQSLGALFTDSGTHYVTKGQPYRAETVVHCSHGFGANALSFSALAECLCDPTTAFVAHDHPGFGLTSTDEAAGLSASLTLELTKDFGGDNIAYVGHSMGAIAALEAGLERNAPVILIAPALMASRRAELGDDRGPGPMANAASFLAPLFNVPTRFVLRRAVYSKNFWRRGLDAAWGGSSPQIKANGTAFYALASRVDKWDSRLFKFMRRRLTDQSRDRDLIQRAIKQNLRVLVIHGTKDPIIPIDNSRLLYCALPRASLAEVAGAGHNVHEQSPSKVASLIKDFLASAEPAVLEPPASRLSDDLALERRRQLDTHDDRGPVALLGDSWRRSRHQAQNNTQSDLPPWPVFVYDNGDDAGRLLQPETNASSSPSSSSS